jgi:hypothetical protein
MVNSGCHTQPAHRDASVPSAADPQHVLGGGTVFDGPFIFDLRLFRDLSFNPHPVAESLYGDLDDVSAWIYWFYKGADPIGPLETYWGTLPHVEWLLQETYPTLQTGSSGGRTGGVMLPGGFLIEGESKSGDRIQVALKVVTPDREYGAMLTFTLQKSRNSFGSINVSVLPLIRTEPRTGWRCRARWAVFCSATSEADYPSLVASRLKRVGVSPCTHRPRYS